LAAAVILAAQAAYAAVTQQRSDYRFDDVMGSSGAGAQWVIVTATGGTSGDRAILPIRAGANIVNDRSPVYTVSYAAAGGLNPTEVIPVSRDIIRQIFMVIPESTQQLDVHFDWLPPYPPADSLTQDVGILSDVYDARKVQVTTPGARSSLSEWEFSLSKSVNASQPETVVNYMYFHQNPRDLSSQTIQIPFVIANVRNGTAEAEPLFFRSTMRESYSGGGNQGGGEIVAYDRFKWDVKEDFTYGPKNTDWVLVPVKNLPIDSNTVNYRMRTDITNYSALRYALQRYDGLSSLMPLYPARWAMDLPASAPREVESDLSLDSLSHIPPGLITTYDQEFNVVRGLEEAFNMYPVDSPTPQNYRNLKISHPSIFGLDLGSEKGDDYIVTGFRLLASDPEFTNKLTSALGVSLADMPTTDDGVIGGITGQGYVAGDAVNTLTIDAALPRRIVTASRDITGVLPLQITLKMTNTNRFVAPKWESLLAEWRSPGSSVTLKNRFADLFSLYVHSPDEKNLNLFDWLQRNNAFEKAVKIFIDEANNYVTLSFIVMLVDGSSTAIRIVDDVTNTTDNSYIVMVDGKKDDRWGTTFFTAPVDYLPSDLDPGDGKGGSGGGCGAGLPFPAMAAAALAALAALALKKFKKEK
jgi:hypothetical protein